MARGFNPYKPPREYGVAVAVEDGLVVPVDLRML
jgi:hypothetical protein